MIKRGDKIIIRYSTPLKCNGNLFLVNKRGIVTSVLFQNGSLVGVFADVKITTRKPKNYFIPAQSIESKEYVEQLRTINLLKNTTL